MVLSPSSSSLSSLSMSSSRRPLRVWVLVVLSFCCWCSCYNVNVVQAATSSWSGGVNITVPPTSKQISYFIHSMDEPGTIDMSHFLFQTADDVTNIAEDTTSSAIDVSVFRVGDYNPSSTEPTWRFCNLEHKEGFADIADLNEFNDCLTPDQRDEWVSHGVGGYVDVVGDDDAEEGGGGDDVGTNNNNNSTTTSPLLKWCCTPEAVDAGLCLSAHEGRILVNQTLFDGNHRFVPIARVSAVNTALTHGKLIQPHHQGGTYVVIIANCNPHGRPLQVVGPWKWVKASEDNSHGGILHGDDNGDDNNNTTTPTTATNSTTDTTTTTPPADGEDPTASPTTQSSSTSTNETALPGDNDDMGDNNSTSTSSSTTNTTDGNSTTPDDDIPPAHGTHPTRAPHPGASHPTHAPHPSATHPPFKPPSSTGAPHTGSGGNGNGGPSLGATDSNNTDGEDNAPTAKAAAAALAVVLGVTIVGVVFVRKRIGRTHQLVGNGNHFNDLELVEQRKDEPAHFTDYGEHGYMPNFS